MVVVKVLQGALRGAVNQTHSGKKFYSFKGIPYAKPPVGDLRFKAPQPPEKWSGIRPATEHGAVCPQWNIFTNQYIEGDEDCLFLNVYSPQIDGKLLPVMFWIYGGGFCSGSGDSDTYGPDYLIEEDVVLVTINYRLETLGFLCLDTEDVPGNAGMKDQVAALRWVHENIEVFGGDPNNVTIFGESAGGASVTYHMVSPASRGLFHKAIVQSGCFLNSWTHSVDGFSLAKRLAKFLGIDSDDAETLTKFFKSAPKEKLIKANLNILSSDERMWGLPILFAPIVEKVSNGDTKPFLTKPPMDLIRDGEFARVPVMFGFNEAESVSSVPHVVKKMKVINDNFHVKLPREIVKSVKGDLLRDVGEEVKRFYFGEELRAGQNQSICDFCSDMYFLYGGIKFANVWSTISTSPFYFYHFCYEGKLNLMKKHLGVDNVKGAGHADDLFYLFKTPLDVNFETDDGKTVKTMTKMWTNFAKFGNPTPREDQTISTIWKPYTINEKNYLNVDKTIDLRQNLIQYRFDFWDDIYKKLQISTLKSRL